MKKILHLDLKNLRKISLGVCREGKFPAKQTPGKLKVEANNLFFRVYYFISFI